MPPRSLLSRCLLDGEAYEQMRAEPCTVHEEVAIGRCRYRDGAARPRKEKRVVLHLSGETSCIPDTIVKGSHFELPQGARVRVPGEVKETHAQGHQNKDGAKCYCHISLPFLTNGLSV